MSAYTCPNGHRSAEADYCDECGAKIAGVASPDATPAATAAPDAAPAAAPPGATPGGVASPEAAGPPAVSVTDPTAQLTPAGQCPHCGVPRSGETRFCEDCGFDYTTGKIPSLPVEEAAPAGQWTATIFANREYFDTNDIEGVDFPADPPSRIITLPSPQARIGRKSRTKGTAPEIDLTAETADPGVSHSHALLTLNIDGVWLVSDLGSTNGTYLNDEEQPLGAGQSRALKDGDQVHVGAWTTITMHAP
ncbi:FHA domain-containing protein [Actinoplanes sp. NPDC051851]|uniref:FHA domain-containing protein n=1 Tax=Actinoplanes sp. NPDC051851 TaxID=3154753 RepID=UPI0034200440